MIITLATLPLASAQEVADQVVKHLLTQMKKSEDAPRKNCLYRGPNGLQCAAGCLMSDSEDALVDEGSVPSEHAQLISDFQRIHDYSPVSKWHQYLAVLCSEYGLKFNPPETV